MLNLGTLSPDRCITLHRPWNYAMAHYGKGGVGNTIGIENRTWPPPSTVLGRRLALHSGGGFDRAGHSAMKLGRFGAAARACPDDHDVPAKRIEMTVHVIGWVQIFDPNGVDPVQLPMGGVEWHGQRVRHSPGLTEDQLAAALASPWLFGPYGWVLTDGIVLPEPIAIAGAMRVWALPYGVTSDIAKQERSVRAAGGDR